MYEYFRLQHSKLIRDQDFINNISNTKYKCTNEDIASINSIPTSANSITSSISNKLDNQSEGELIIVN